MHFLPSTQIFIQQVEITFQCNDSRIQIVTNKINILVIYVWQYSFFPTPLNVIVTIIYILLNVVVVFSAK